MYECPALGFPKAELQSRRALSARFSGDSVSSGGRLACRAPARMSLPCACSTSAVCSVVGEGGKKGNVLC